VHAQFIAAVSEGRRMPPAEVRQFADGRIFSGVQARSLRMVDTLGSLEDAVNRAAALAGLPLPPRVLPPRRKFSVFDLVRNAAGINLPMLVPPSLPAFKAPLFLMD
jgi:protease-4